MKKRDKLYTVNKWNKNQFCKGGNLFPDGGPLVSSPTPLYIPGVGLPKTVPGISVPKSSGPMLGRIGGGALGAAGSLVNTLGSKLISDGYSTGGVGEGIAGVGNAAGQIVSQFNPIAGAIVSAASGIVGGVVNRGFGTKRNDKNINIIQTNTADARNAGNLLASSSTSDALLSNAGSMTTSSDFGTRDLVKGGWFAKGKAARQGQKFIDAENNALAYQNHGLTTGAEKVDNNLDSTAQSNFIYAFGGPLDYITGGDMGAINYGFMTDYLTAKNRQAEASNKMPGISPTTNVFAEGGIEIKHPGRLTRLKERTGKTEAELWAEGRPEVRKMITFARNSRKWSKALGGKIERDGITIPDNVFCGGGKIFALGGDIQTNGADFTNGAQHINAGGSHEESPYEGVQVGVDPQGVPNLVEENEVIFNDYVYSDRIQIDNTTKEKFRISKKREMSYANLAKKLEKESLERPNDPISKAALKKQMEELANQQERQKEMAEAQRAEEVSELLNPEMKSNISAEGGPINTFAGTQDGSNKMVNAGKWKKGTSAENWNTYTRQGLMDYLQNVVNRINSAKSSDEKDKIRQEAINTVNNIQNAYAKAYQGNLTPSQENEAVRNLQSVFQNANGNAYFDNIADNIILPAGHNTQDVPGTWVDGYWGPRTSIRNWGSTEYGDESFYKDLADLATQGGFVYAPNADLSYGDGNQLYTLSLANAANVTPTATPTIVKRPVTLSDVAKDAMSTPDFGGAGINNVFTVPTDINIGTVSTNGDVKPNYRPEWLRYAGLLGPAVGLGMQALGIGRPDTKALDAVLEGYDRRGAAAADYRTIGDYLRYTPMDIWAQQNRMNASARATDRAMQNNSAPIGTQMAGLLASNYNDQNASGQLYRQALEYNDNLRRMTGEFNRGTNQFNAQAYNQAALQNAEIRNRDRQIRAQLGMQAAAQKADMDAGWYNGIYGNVSGLFKGISDLGRENAQHNMIARGIADGVWGVMTPNTNTAYGYLKSNADGGKVTRKKNKKHRKGGLTF